MSTSTWLGAAVVTANLLCWLTFRIDKAAAIEQRARVSERTLLLLSALGGVGAVLGMFAHRQRHKTRKLRFVLLAPLAALAQLAAIAAHVMR